MSEEFLKKVQGGRLKIELEEARFHCTEIKAMYNKGIKKWIEDLKYQDKIDDYEHNSLHILFNEYLPDSDNIIIRSIENLNNEAGNSADIILEALYNRNIKIAESEVNNISHKLAIHRKQLSEEIIKLQKLRNEFLELVMNF